MAWLNSQADRHVQQAGQKAWQVRNVKESWRNGLSQA